MASLVIRPIPLCLIALPLEARLYRVRAGSSVPVGVTAFYIEGAKRNIVVDAGGSAADFTARGLMGARDVQTMEQGLAKLGLKPDDIDLVILTHLHYDHTFYAPLFKKAKFLVQKAELDYQLNCDPVDPRPCDKALLDTLDFQVIEGDYQVEEGIKVLFTPGHTAGNQSVAVDTAKGVAIIDGLCGLDENFSPPAAMKRTGPVVAPSTHTDAMVAYRSMLRVKQMADIVVPLHEARLLFVDRIP